MWVLLVISSWQDEQTEAMGVMLVSSFGLAGLLPVLIVVGRSVQIGQRTVGGLAAPGGLTWHPRQFLIFKLSAPAPLGIRTWLKSFTLPPAIDDNTVRAEAMQVGTGLGRVYGVNHILEIDGFFRLVIRPHAGNRAAVYVRGVGIVTDDTELGVIVAIGAVRAQQLVTLVAVRDGHDSPAV